jgi:site-specific recombinase XerD
MKLQEYLKENYSPTAIISYEQIIDRYLSFSNGEAKTATYQDILDYIGYLRKEGKHPKTIRNNLYGLKIYYRWLVKTGQRNDHPCQHLYLKDKINRAIPIENLYTPEQLENLLQNYEYRPLKNHSPKKEQIEQRNKTIISLLIYQALTALEITQLEVENVDLEKAEIFVKPNVKNKERTLHLKASQILLLHQYIHETRPKLSPKTSALVINYRGERIISQSVIDAINPPNQEERISPLKIRQSVIAHLLKQGNDLRIVQVFAGHRSSASTEAYRQTGLEELKASIKKHHPLQ